VKPFFNRLPCGLAVRVFPTPQPFNRMMMPLFAIPIFFGSFFLLPLIYFRQSSLRIPPVTSLLQGFATVFSFFFRPIFNHAIFLPAPIGTSPLLSCDHSTRSASSDFPIVPWSFSRNLPYLFVALCLSFEYSLETFSWFFVAGTNGVSFFWFYPPPPVTDFSRSMTPAKTALTPVCEGEKTGFSLPSLLN